VNFLWDTSNSFDFVFEIKYTIGILNILKVYLSLK
jgi:hypothetical protein